MSKEISSRLVAIGQNRSKLWHSPEGVAYADVILGGRIIACRIESQLFSDWLKRSYYLEAGSECGKKSMTSAIFNLVAIAKMNAPAMPVFNRVGKAYGCYYLDLGTSCGCTVKYSGDGWGILDFAPLRFSRSLECLPLPIPTKSKKGKAGLNEFFQLIGIKEENRSTLANFLVKCLLPDRCLRAPTLSIYGKHGVSTSLAAEALKRLIDPFTVNKLHHVPSPRNLAECAELSRVILYENFNVEQVSPDQIDYIVQISRGDGFTTGLKRPQINAYIDNTTTWQIGNIGIEIQSILDGAIESEFGFWHEFNIYHPSALGELLDDVCDHLFSDGIEM